MCFVPATQTSIHPTSLHFAANEACDDLRFFKGSLRSADAVANTDQLVLF